MPKMANIAQKDSAALLVCHSSEVDWWGRIRESFGWGIGFGFALGLATGKGVAEGPAPVSTGTCFPLKVNVESDKGSELISEFVERKNVVEKISWVDIFFVRKEQGTRNED